MVHGELNVYFNTDIDPFRSNDERHTCTTRRIPRALTGQTRMVIMGIPKVGPMSRNNSSRGPVIVKDENVNYVTRIPTHRIPFNTAVINYYRGIEYYNIFNRTFRHEARANTSPSILYVTGRQTSRTHVMTRVRQRNDYTYVL